MARSKIEWTETTWNPVTGCTKISSGCKFCYAEIMARRLKAMGQEKYKNGFELALHPETLKDPYKWKRPGVIFVNSMSDLFHKDIPVDFIQKVFKTMNENPRHVFQVLTKRADVLAYYDSEDLLNWTHNIWAGVTVEDASLTRRVDFLRRTGARVKFVSCEPLLSDIPDIDLNGIDWLIAGGESGRIPRPMKEEWVLNLRNACKKQEVAFYFKQWGGTNKKKNGRKLQGEIYDELPINGPKKALKNQAL